MKGVSRTTASLSPEKLNLRMPELTANLCKINHAKENTVQENRSPQKRQQLQLRRKNLQKFFNRSLMLRDMTLDKIKKTHETLQEQNILTRKKVRDISFIKTFINEAQERFIKHNQEENQRDQLLTKKMQLRIKKEREDQSEVFKTATNNFEELEHTTVDTGATNRAQNEKRNIQDLKEEYGNFVDKDLVNERIFYFIEKTYGGEHMDRQQIKYLLPANRVEQIKANQEYQYMCMMKKLKKQNPYKKNLAFQQQENSNIILRNLQKLQVHFKQELFKDQDINQYMLLAQNKEKLKPIEDQILQNFIDKQRQLNQSIAATNSSAGQIKTQNIITEIQQVQNPIYFSTSKNHQKTTSLTTKSHKNFSSSQKYDIKLNLEDYQEFQNSNEHNDSKEKILNQSITFLGSDHHQQNEYVLENEEKQFQRSQQKQSQSFSKGADSQIESRASISKHIEPIKLKNISNSFSMNQKNSVSSSSQSINNHKKNSHGFNNMDDDSIKSGSFAAQITQNGDNQHDKLQQDRSSILQQNHQSQRQSLKSNTQSMGEPGDSSPIFNQRHDSNVSANFGFSPEDNHSGTSNQKNHKRNSTNLATAVVERLSQHLINSMETPKSNFSMSNLVQQNEGSPLKDQSMVSLDDKLHLKEPPTINQPKTTISNNNTQSQSRPPVEIIGNFSRAGAGGYLNLNYDQDKKQMLATAITSIKLDNIQLHSKDFYKYFKQFNDMMYQDERDRKNEILKRYVRSPPVDPINSNRNDGLAPSSLSPTNKIKKQVSMEQINQVHDKFFKTILFTEEQKEYMDKQIKYMDKKVFSQDEIQHKQKIKEAERQQQYLNQRVKTPALTAILDDLENQKLLEEEKLEVHQLPKIKTRHQLLYQGKSMNKSDKIKSLYSPSCISLNQTNNSILQTNNSYLYKSPERLNIATNQQTGGGTGHQEFEFQTPNNHQNLELFEKAITLGNMISKQNKQNEFLKRKFDFNKRKFQQNFQSMNKQLINLF